MTVVGRAIVSTLTSSRNRKHYGARGREAGREGVGRHRREEWGRHRREEGGSHRRVQTWNLSKKPGLSH